MEDKFKKMHELLTQEYEWPNQYMFKFIAPVDKVAAVTALFNDGFKTSNKPSKKGNYISITAVGEVESPDMVIKVYQAAGAIAGVISL